MYSSDWGYGSVVGMCEHSTKILGAMKMVIFW
jgi:hypothetical protein